MCAYMCIYVYRGREGEYKCNSVLPWRRVHCGEDKEKNLLKEIGTGKRESKESLQMRNEEWQLG